MYSSFWMLSFAVLSVWLPVQRLGFGKLVAAPWQILFTAAVILGVASGVLAPLALVTLAFLFLLCHYTTRVTSVASRRALEIGAMLVALTLAMHLAPGFKNPKLYDAIQFSPLSAPISVYLNFDKAAAGLALLVYLCVKPRSPELMGNALRTTAMCSIVTVAIVIGAALAAHYIAFDPKPLAQVATFVAVNFVFACVAEEAFFRGVLQERLRRVLGSRPIGMIVTIGISAALFGLVHAAGGPKLIALATVAGFGYAFTYAKTERVEASIAVHALVNAAHFAFFTYPYAI